MKSNNFREKLDRAIVKSIISTKYKLGLGLDTKKNNKFYKHIS